MGMMSDVSAVHVEISAGKRDVRVEHRVYVAAVIVNVTGGFVFFFFQAEDGIRDYKVTGVQTCALPIFSPRACRTRFAIRSSPSRPSRNYCRNVSTTRISERISTRSSSRKSTDSTR